MFRKFLKENNIQESIATRDIERQIKNIDLENYNIKTKFNIFNRLARIYINLEPVAKYLEKQGKENTECHKQLSVLEQFIRHLIKHFEFEQDFNQLIKKNKIMITEELKNKQSKVNYVINTKEQTFIDDFETVEVIESKECKNTNIKEIKVDEKDLDILDILDVEE
ncbi:hypothetical protein SDC9_48151 [bioreactor metagenome]|uniref:Uncharacterized protein n=1 Tax=bioreactor metagenome TaxID=1076179 RepID=A0A644WEL3_9ZZZZ